MQSPSTKRNPVCRTATPCSSSPPTRLITFGVRGHPHPRSTPSVRTPGVHTRGRKGSRRSWWRPARRTGDSCMGRPGKREFMLLTTNKRVIRICSLLISQPEVRGVVYHNNR